MSSSVCLLVLLGALAAYGHPLNGDCAVSQDISKLLKLDDQDIGSKPLFSSVLFNINTSCQRKEDVVLLNTTLDVYARIFSSILQKHGHDHRHASALLGQMPLVSKNRVTEEVSDLQKKMEALKGHLGSYDDNRVELIRRLNGIKVDDPKVQRRALAEYQSVCRAVSLISHQS